MDERVRFVVEYERDEQTVAELCAGYGISRATGYVWLRRYRPYGLHGLMDLNRAANRHPNQKPAAVEKAVLELRQVHMRWGSRSSQVAEWVWWLPRSQERELGRLISVGEGTSQGRWATRSLGIRAGTRIPTTSSSRQSSRDTQGIASEGSWRLRGR